MDYWRERLATLLIVCGAESLRRRLPDDSHLQRIEAQYQLRLPTSYCGFVRVFGPGMLARAFAIYAPGYKGRKRASSWLKRTNAPASTPFLRPPLLRGRWPAWPGRHCLEILGFSHQERPRAPLP